MPVVLTSQAEPVDDNEAQSLTDQTPWHCASFPREEVEFSGQGFQARLISQTAEAVCVNVRARWVGSRNKGQEVPQMY